MNRITFTAFLCLALLLFAFLLPLAAQEAESNDAMLKMPLMDIRAVKLGKFFEAYHCPKPYYIDEYISSADKYNIPYTLLPAISIQESTCGQHQLYSNWWGYWSDTRGFQSVQEGIGFISEQLAVGRPYADKTILGKISAYNGVDYAHRIINLINKIESE